jgi:two-component sensor histidine kinase
MHTLLHSTDHKELMLGGLYATFIIIYAVSSVIALHLDIYPLFFTKIFIAVLSSFLLYKYLKSYRIGLYATLLIIIVELDIAISVLYDQFDSFTMAHPFILIFGFFFFFKLKNALIATTLHYIYWISIIMYTQYFFPLNHPALTPTSMLNMLVASFFILIFSLFYYFSTEVSYAKLAHSNRQNEILLKEIHHRIKNNLNMIASILGLQIISLKNNHTENAGEILLKSKLRIEAIAKIHEALYTSSDLEKIDFADYIHQLADSINQSYGRKIPLRIQGNNIALSLETMLNVGIIVNELITNTIKHSLQNSRDAKNIIHISLQRKFNTYILTYHEENNHNADLHKLENSESLGMKLIRLTVKQMDAEMEIFQKNRLIFSIVFDVKQ